MNAGSAAVCRRLGNYWKMEGACALVFPPLALLLVRPIGAFEWGVLLFALFACCSLLVIGSLYWRASLRLIRHDPTPMQKLLRIANPLQRPLLILSLLSAVAAVLVILARGASPAALAASGFAVLAILEYANYFHVQLQNFDHLPDLKRLVRDRRFRPSHLATDLVGYRKRTVERPHRSGPKA